MSWTSDDLAYAAGFLDGEGCFSISANRKVTVSCSNTQRPVIEWFKAMFGGSIATMPARKSTHRRVFSWQVVCKDAERVCSAVAPYLQLKADQALMCLYVQSLAADVGRRPTPEVRAEQERFVHLVKEAKRVAW